MKKKKIVKVYLHATTPVILTNFFCDIEKITKNFNNEIKNCQSLFTFYHTSHFDEFSF